MGLYKKTLNEVNNCHSLYGLIHVASTLFRVLPYGCKAQNQIAIYSQYLYIFDLDANRKEDFEAAKETLLIYLKKHRVYFFWLDLCNTIKKI